LPALITASKEAKTAGVEGLKEKTPTLAHTAEETNGYRIVEGFVRWVKDKRTMAGLGKGL